LGDRRIKQRLRGQRKAHEGFVVELRSGTQKRRGTLRKFVYE
jgi:hypothetical protein